MLSKMKKMRSKIEVVRQKDERESQTRTRAAKALVSKQIK